MMQLGFLLILLISFIIISPTFNIGLFGDDWLSFFRYADVLGKNSYGQYNYLTYFLTPYGAQDILMGLLQNVYGFESAYYFMTSFILRNLAAISFYPLVFYLTKSKLAVLFAVLFFSVTVVGLDATDWVFNMPSYITIALFNIFLYFFLKAREGGRKTLLISGLFYYLAYIITPIRMHGSLVFIFLLELFWFTQNKNIQTLKKIFLRISIIIAIFLFIRFSGFTLGPPEEAMQRLSLGLNTSIQLIGRGKLEFLFYPFIMVGSMILPDFILPLQRRNIILSLIGITIFLLTIFLIKKIKKNNISTGLFLGLSWSIMSFFFAWWWTPTTLFPTAYRYLIVSAQGIAIMLASIIGAGKDKINQRFLFIFLCLLVIIHIISTRIYINFLINTHGHEISKKIWSSIPYISDIGKSSQSTIFYFEGDSGTAYILHDVITFGFPPHMGLLYNLNYRSIGFPVGTNNWQEVISAVKTGSIKPAFGPPPDKPIPIDHIYAFHLNIYGDLIDITTLAREKLKQISSESNQ